MTLRDLPPVRALAEKRAREFLNALSAPAVTWEAMPDTPESRRIKERHVETHLRLLTDLTRPDSMDAVARLVASKMNREGWQVTQAIEDCGVELLVLCEDAHVDWSAMETASVADVLTTIAFAVLA